MPSVASAGHHARAHELDLGRVERRRHQPVGEDRRTSNRTSLRMLVKPKQRPVLRRVDARRLLPRRAVRPARHGRAGKRFVPRSDAWSRNASMPCVAGVSCCVPPSRYTLAATTSFAVFRRRITLRPLTSKVVVAVSVCAAATAGGGERQSDSHRGERLSRSRADSGVEQLRRRQIERAARVRGEEHTRHVRLADDVLGRVASADPRASASPSCRRSRRSSRDP